LARRDVGGEEVGFQETGGGWRGDPREICEERKGLGELVEYKKKGEGTLKRRIKKIRRGNQGFRDGVKKRAVGHERQKVRREEQESQVG